jgi:small basic protein
MFKKLTSAIRRYIDNQDGNFAIFTALLGVPLLIVVSVAIDSKKINNVNTSIMAALDTAALAAVVPANLDRLGREKYAREVFDKNYMGNVPVKLSIIATRERVDITGRGKVPTMMGGILGIDSVGVKGQSIAELTRSDVVCVLALDPSGAKAIEFTGQARFNSPACSVQVNSTHAKALVSSLAMPPVASSFCTSGISQGMFTPSVKHACTPVEDPYANLTPPENGWCIPPQLVSGYLGLFQAGSSTVDAFGNDTVLFPGTYCKGLRVKGVNVTFLPGTYIISGGKFEISEDSQITGDGVTFVLKGNNGGLEVKSDAQVNFKAPSTGPYAGMVFYQVPDIPKFGRKPKFPTGTSNIKSGGGLSIVGTAYFPSQDLIITSFSPVASKSPATSFIAYRLKFAGRSNTQVHVDHESGGIPPLLPRSDEGARLVR